MSKTTNVLVIYRNSENYFIIYDLNLQIRLPNDKNILFKNTEFVEL